MDARHPLKKDGMMNLERILLQYVELAFVDDSASKTKDTTNTKEAVAHYKMVGGVSIEFCVVTERTDLLFSSALLTLSLSCTTFPPRTA